MKKNIICPFCEEGTLETTKCKKCSAHFLICDECESLYKDEKSLDEEVQGWKCPVCNEKI